MTVSPDVGREGWARFGSPVVARTVDALIENDQLVVSRPFVFEALHSARDLAQFTLWRDRFDTAFRSVDPAGSTWDLAQRAFGELAASAAGNQRAFGTTDLLLAALAHEHGLGLLHFDRHFDVILDRTFLVFPSQPLAEWDAFGALPPPSERKRRNNAIKHRLALFKDDAEAKGPQLDTAELLDRHLARLNHQLPPKLE